MAYAMRSSRGFRATRGAMSAVVVALALAACGSSSGGGKVAGSGTGPSSGTFGSAAGSYLVGVPVPRTGPQAQSGTDILNAEQLAADEINAAGGVLGHKVELKVEDDACDPQTSVNAANKLVSQGVQAVVGAYCSGAALPAESVYGRKGLPNLQPSANSTSLTKQGLKDLFLLDPSGSLQADEAAKFLVSVVKKDKVVVADDQSAYSVDIATLAAKDITKLGGMIASTQAVPATATDLASVIAAIRGSGATSVYWTGYYAQGALFVKQLRNAGLNVTFVAADGSVDPTFIKDAGASSANGTFATIALTSQFLTGPKAGTFTSAYTKKFGSAPGPYSAYAFDAMNTLAEAAKNAKSLAPDKVSAALHQINVPGLTGQVSFAPDGNRIGAKFVVLQVVDGKYTLAPQQP